MAIHQRRSLVLLGDPSNRARPWRGTEEDRAFAPDEVQNPPLASRSTYGSLPPYIAGGGGLGAGGYRNAATGAGTYRDSASFAQFVPTHFIVREQIEVIYVESWVAAKLIDVPVDDSFNRWRRWIDDERGVMAAQERRHNVRERLSDAWKNARLYGTGLAILLTSEAPTETPLNVDALRAGSLQNILVVDRFDVDVDEVVSDPFSPNYNKPALYRVRVGNGGQSLDVHPSRVIRFDGVKPTSGEWRIYEPRWGISELVNVMKAIYEDASISSALAHKIESFSTVVLKMAGFDEIAGAGELRRNDPDRPSAEQRMNVTRRMESVYHTTVIDNKDDVVEKSVSFAGLPELMDRYHQRLAAAADIPATRFLAKSPDGMNATGDSDSRNYAMMIKSLQENVLAPRIDLLDRVLARDAGLPEPPAYEWIPLFALSEAEQADIKLKQAQAADIAANALLVEPEDVLEWLGIDAMKPTTRGRAP